MDSLLISIITYKRPDMCRRLVDLTRYETDADINVFHDGGGLPYYHVDALQFTLHKPPGHRHFAETWDHVLDSCRKSDADTFVFLPDDVTPAVTNPVERMLSHLEHCDVIVPLVDGRGRGPCWVPVDPVDERERWLTHWVDGCFACSRDVLEALSWRVPHIPAEHFSTNASSGVGKYMSLALWRSGLRVCQVSDTLYEHGEHDSQMHYDERKRNPL